MKATFFLCLLATAVLCQKMHYSFHYKNGDLTINKGSAGKINGPVMLEFLSYSNNTNIGGMYVSGSTKSSFYFHSITRRYESKSGSFAIEADCLEGNWGLQALRKMSGKVTVVGKFGSFIDIQGTCTTADRSRNFTFKANGTPSNATYTPAEGAKRAMMLVGQKSTDYRPVDMVNFAVFGYPYVQTVSCRWFLNYNRNETEAKPGYVIVGKDGRHCGIVDPEGDKFVQSNQAKGSVTLNTLTTAQQFFPKGFFYHRY